MPNNKKKKTILIVDDEPEIIELLSSELSVNYSILTAANGQECLDVARKHRPALILLDITMPILDGLAACRALKADIKTRAIPVLILSARTEIQYLLDAFEIGVDDYIEKPFRFPELEARIKSKLRHFHMPRADKAVRIGNLLLEPNNLAVYVGGKPVAFSQSEFKLVSFLAENFGKVLTRAEILKNVWAKDSVSERTVDIYLVKIRKKLEKFDHEIAMLYGTGYVLRPRAEAVAAE